MTCNIVIVRQKELIMWESFGVTIITESVKHIFQAIPKSIDKWRFRRFFGPSALNGDNIFGVIDPFSHPLPATGNRYIKRFLGRKPDQPLIGVNDVLGICVVRIVSYCAATFSEFRKDGKSIAIVTDETVSPTWDGTFIAFGSSDSNIKTLDIESLNEQSFYTLGFGPMGLRRISAGDKHFDPTPGRDFGIVLRMINPRYPEHFFVCLCRPWRMGNVGSLFFSIKPLERALSYAWDQRIF